MTILDIRYQQLQPNDPFLMIQAHGYKRPIKLSEILAIEGQHNYTVFHLQNGQKIVSSRTLGLFEKSLAAHAFVRLNKSVIINVRHVQTFFNDGTLVVQLPNDQLYTCSRRRSLDVRKFIISHN